MRASNGSIRSPGRGITRRALMSNRSGVSIRYVGRLTLFSSRGTGGGPTAGNPTAAAGGGEWGAAPGVAQPASPRRAARHARRTFGRDRRFLDTDGTPLWFGEPGALAR